MVARLQAKTPTTKIVGEGIKLASRIIYDLKSNYFKAVLSLINSSWTNFVFRDTQKIEFKASLTAIASSAYLLHFMSVLELRPRKE